MARQLLQERLLLLPALLDLSSTTPEAELGPTTVAVLLLRPHTYMRICLMAPNLPNSSYICNMRHTAGTAAVGEGALHGYSAMQHACRGCLLLGMCKAEKLHGLDDDGPDLRPACQDVHSLPAGSFLSHSCQHYNQYPQPSIGWTPAAGLFFCTSAAVLAECWCPQISHGMSMLAQEPDTKVKPNAINALTSSELMLKGRFLTNNTLDRCNANSELKHQQHGW